MLWGLMAIVPEKRTEVATLGDLRDAIWRALVSSGTQQKALADGMRLTPSHLSRQLREQGVNLWRLLGAGDAFWKHFLPELAALVGVSMTDGRDEREKKQDERIAELERQLSELLKRMPAPSKDATETRVA